MLVSLNISQWSARKYDRSVSHEIETLKNATNAGRFNKILIDGEELKDLRKWKVAARNLHYYNTLAWGDNGERVIPAANYFDYVQKFNEIKIKYDLAVSEFITEYAAYVEDSKKRLGDMFNVADYPPAESIRYRFGMSLTFMPLPNIADFRVDLQDGEVDKLKKEMADEIDRRLNSITDEIVDRIKEVVQHIHDRLSEKDAIFRDSLIGNLESLLEVLPKLNFSGDQKIGNLIVDLKGLVQSPDELRENPKLRTTTANKAALILKQLG